MNTPSTPLHIPWGTPINKVTMISGYALMALGIVILAISQHPVSWFALVAGSIMGLLREGLVIDVEQQRSKSYMGMLGIKLGRWESLDMYPYLVLLRAKTRFAPQLTRSPVIYLEGTSYSEITYDLYFMSANHLRRNLIISSKDRDKSLELARNLTEDLGKEFVKYNPGQLVHQGRY